MKVIITPFVILIITLLSQPISINISKGAKTIIEIKTLLISFKSNINKKSFKPLKLFKNVMPLFDATSFICKNAAIRYGYDKSNETNTHILTIKTHVIILLISLIIFLYSKAKRNVEKRLQGVR